SPAISCARQEQEFVDMGLLFFRQPEQTDKLPRGEMRCSRQWACGARVRRREADRSGIDDDAAIRTNSETSHPTSDRTGQSQLAGGIQKKQDAFAGAITFPGFPQAGPFTNRQCLPSLNASHGLIHMKVNLDGSDAVSLG